MDDYLRRWTDEMFAMFKSITITAMARSDTFSNHTVIVIMTNGSKQKNESILHLEPTI